MARTTTVRADGASKGFTWLRQLFSGRFMPLACLLLVLAQTGCTSPRDFCANGCKVGPNYKEPPTPVAADWIKGKDWNDADAKLLDKETTAKLEELKLGPTAWTKLAEKAERKRNELLGNWWTVFQDPVLDKLICHAYHGNLSLRQAVFQVLAARAQLGISIGNFLPQSQNAYADFNRSSNSTQTAFSAFIPKRFYNQFDTRFNLAWELDVWGKFRRGIENSTDTLDATVYNYDDVLVTMLSDVATYYVMMRVYEKRIHYARMNVIEQQKAVAKVEARKKVGVAKQLDLDQVEAVLYQTAATIPQLEIGLRLANNQLCVLLGVPPEDLRLKLGPPRDPEKPIPYAPPEVAVSIPADLLRQRPDVREAERQAAAQCALIGYAEADFYPHFSIIGDFGWSAEKFRNIFSQVALASVMGPNVQWNVLQYGRILNNMRTQDATFQQLVAQYQNTVLIAQQEVENGMVTFLKGQQAVEMQDKCVKHLENAHRLILTQYEAGLVDISQLVLILQALAIQQDQLAQNQGQVATGLIQVYAALGGGWELRQTGCEEAPEAGHGTDPTEAMRQRGHFLPYPRVLKESGLPVFDGGKPVDSHASQPAAGLSDKAATGALEKKVIVQPFEKRPALGQGGKDAGVANDPFRSPNGEPIDLPIPPRPAEIGIPQVEPPVQDNAGPPNVVVPVPVQVGPPTSEPSASGQLPMLEPIVPILPKIPN